eukprot:CAMPEP_0198246004 /NCGR_PEP_ID=MMETSP1446-20131203/44067_1 /TAXON_ID=1461542 ORGANISM="Unidentified sp, Strain CCMP2111" /NCGR_SAMPLE_ID=MMETSP1446 /ASSEMBLY_ACC=CAM_ASM_001112 /LENGTH=343 /DNA_ID=CAMNT_0043930261 /DNA_START=85 /DNA_END=1112 /DNA_ORIENTATION=-
MRVTRWQAACFIVLGFLMGSQAVRQEPLREYVDDGSELDWGKISMTFSNSSDTGELTYDADEARYLYFFATASYCPVDNLKKWNSGRKFKMHPEVTDVYAYNATVPIFFGVEDAPVQFFSAYDPLSFSIVLSFEGTAGGAPSWVNDFMYYMVKPNSSWNWPDEASGVYLEKGFRASWDRLRVNAFKSTRDLVAKHPNANLVITGHSLGGALAALAAADFTMNGMEVSKVITFGQPRLGNMNWAHLYDSTLGLRNITFRLVNHRDPVPRIPFTDISLLRGYHHTGIEVWYNVYNYTQCNDVSLNKCKFSPMCNYNEDKNCSISPTFCITSTCIGYHTNYFQTTS